MGTGCSGTEGKASNSAGSSCDTSEIHDSLSVSALVPGKCRLARAEVDAKPFAGDVCAEGLGEYGLGRESVGELPLKGESNMDSEGVRLGRSSLNDEGAVEVKLTLEAAFLGDVFKLPPPRGS